MMKGGGEKEGKAGRSLPLRLESARFRLLSIVVGCFVFSIVFLLSSRPDATAFDIVSPNPKASSLEDARRPVAAVKTLRSSGSFGRDDFHVDVVPHRRGQSSSSSSSSNGHLEQSTESVRDTVIVEERRSDVDREAERDEHESNAAAVRSNSDDQPARGVKEEEVEANNAVQTTGQPASETPETTQEAGDRQVKLEEQPAARREEEQTSSSSSGTQQQQHHPLCDFSDVRSDVCDFAGDVRMDANASAFVVVDPAAATVGQWHTVRPYPRKGDQTCMGRITEITVRTAPSSAHDAPRCTATHAAPAVAFATGGYTGNIFHDFSDVLVPLYNTAQRYDGDVHLVMANAASWWLVKYARLLRALSRHEVIDLAQAGAKRETHCFPRAVVGLRAHRELVIERDRSLDGLATTDFTRFVRRALGLPRDAPTTLGDDGKTTTTTKSNNKPRLLIISRHRTRLLLNLDAVVRLAEELGFEAIVNESDVANDIAEVGALINSCDAMVGVHGAAMTHFLFMRPGKVFIQVVPLGTDWAAGAYYGEPAERLGLRYVGYKILPEESSLSREYPTGDPVLTDPAGVGKRGWEVTKKVYLDRQNVRLDLKRFRGELVRAHRYLVAGKRKLPRATV